MREKQEANLAVDVDNVLGGVNGAESRLGWKDMWQEEGSILETADAAGR